MKNLGLIKIALITILFGNGSIAFCAETVWPPLNPEATTRRVLDRLLLHSDVAVDVILQYGQEACEAHSIAAATIDGDNNGIIFVCPDIWLVTPNEDQLASTLAHEIAHVENEDALATGGKLHLLFEEWALELEGQELREVKKLWRCAQSVDPKRAERCACVLSAKLAVAKGAQLSAFQRQGELEADRRASEIMEQAGYDPLENASSLVNLYDFDFLSQGLVLESNQDLNGCYFYPEVREVFKDVDMKKFDSHDSPVDRATAVLLEMLHNGSSKVSTPSP